MGKIFSTTTLRKTITKPNLSSTVYYTLRRSLYSEITGSSMRIATRQYSNLRKCWGDG